MHTHRRTDRLKDTSKQMTKQKEGRTVYWWWQPRSVATTFLKALSRYYIWTQRMYNVIPFSNTPKCERMRNECVDHAQRILGD